jgi:hypothetical protein
MKNKAYEVAIQFQLLNQVLRDEVETLKEELAIQKLETAVALMQLSNANARKERKNALHSINPVK